MQLSDRQSAILLKLISLEKICTSKELSKDFNVSSRTIKNDLKEVNIWLSQYQVSYYSKPGKGIWLKIDNKKREQILEELINQDDSNYYIFPERRVAKIIYILCVADGYITSQKIENIIGVSKSTIFSDLNKTEKIMNKFEVSLIRKNYYGYRISGSEISIRSLMEYFMTSAFRNGGYQYNSASVLLFKIKSFSKEKNNGEEFANALGTVVDLFLKNIKFLKTEKADLDYLLILNIRMAIIAIRLSHNHFINSYQTLTNKQSNRIFRFFSLVMNYYDFPLIKDEYFYLVRGASPIFTDSRIFKITKELIKEVSKKCNISFQQDPQLNDNLSSHLLKRLNVKKANFANEFNPFVNDIKQKYSQLFKAVAESLYSLVSSNPVVISDSFVTYVTLHFLVSLEKMKVAQKVKIMYVCSTGIGVTSLIRNEIEQKVANVEIAGFSSMNDIKEKLSILNPDLLVTIFPISGIAIPIIQVSPLPTNDDINAIRLKVSKILKDKFGKLTSKFNGYKSIVTSNKTSIENLSQNLLLNSLSIYIDLKRYFGRKIPDKYQEAFMIHVAMAVNRIFFNKPYSEPTINFLNETINQADITAISENFKKRGLKIPMSEINSILNYTNLNFNQEEVKESRQ